MRMSQAPLENRDYLLYGWRVRSELPLPQAWAGGEDESPVDIVIRLGEVPDKLIDTVHSTPFLQISRDGECRLEVAAAGTYQVRQGREVIVQPAPGATMAEISVFLLGSVVGLLCHQRGLFPLHASCVRIGDGAVAFCGPSGAGKSTLAASLVRRGHSLLCDDITIIDSLASIGSRVRPAMPRMRLWRDSLEALQVPPGSLQRDRIELEKYVLPATNIGGFSTEPLPLRAIFMLQSAKSPQLEGAFQMKSMEAVARLGEQVYRRRQSYVLGRRAALFHEATRIADAVPVMYLARRLDFGLLDETAERVEELAGV